MMRLVNVFPCEHPVDREVRFQYAGDDPKSSQLPPREWLVATRFCIQFISGVIGPGGVGKTSMGILQFLAMAIGKDLTGHALQAG
jgi:RecA-family ATPase